jgi:two-component system phosphate regulon sensor histidine kinase PhoR
MDEQRTVTGAPGTLGQLPRALLRQLVLLVPVVIDLVVSVVARRVGEFGPWYVAGLVLLLAVTAVTALTAPPWRVPLPPTLLVAVLVLDLAAIGLLRLVPGGNGVALLAVLPAMWLASDHRMRGALASVAAVTVLVSTPGLVYFGFEPSGWSRAITLATIALMCAVTVAGTTDVWQRQNEALGRQGQQLQEVIAEMRASRALNEAIVTTVDVGLLALDCSGRFTYSNPRMQEFIGLAYPEGHQGVAGQPGEMWSADRRTRLTIETSPCTRALSEVPFSDYVIWAGRSGDGQRALSVSASRVLDSEGEPHGAVLAYHDITDLMAALKVKDEFVASVSHELRTPLTSILGYMEMALDDPSVSPGLRQQLEVVSRNAKRLLRLVGDLLLSAQADTGQLALENEPMDLTAVVAAAVVDQEPVAADRGVALRQELSGPVVVQADPVRIAQVVENLVSNAVKYTGTGGAVTVGLTAGDREAVITVTDTGMGIKREDQQRLFTRFFRTDEAEQQAIQGVGLGLAITRSIVEGHGGRIDVESELGRGSTFRVTLPLAAATLPGHGARSSAVG